MGNSVGHGKEGTAAAFVFGGHGAVDEVVCKPKAHGSSKSCLVEDFPDETLGPQTEIQVKELPYGNFLEVRCDERFGITSSRSRQEKVSFV